jgi:hypothetical protein
VKIRLFVLISTMAFPLSVVTLKVASVATLRSAAENVWVTVCAPDSVWADAAKLRAASDAPPRKATRRRVEDFGLCVMAVLLAKDAVNQQVVSNMDTF